MQFLLDYLRNDQDYQSIHKGIQKSIEGQIASGLNGSLKTIFIATLQSDNKCPFCVVTHNMSQAQKLYDDLLEFDQQGVFLYPGNDFFMMDYINPSHHDSSRRIETLLGIIEQRARIVVAPINAITKPIAPPSVMSISYRTITVDEELPIDEFAQWLIEIGYSREAKVEEPGQFSVRGGMIDFYPFSSKNPYRIELFDVQIDSIREYDASTQRSIQSVKSVNISPCTEWPITESQYQNLGIILEEMYRNYAANRSKKDLEKFEEQFLADVGMLKDGVAPDQIGKYANLLYKKPYSLLDYLSLDTVLSIDEPGRILEKNKETEREFGEWVLSLIEAGALLPDVLPMYDGNKVFQTKHQKVLIPMMLRKFPIISAGNIVSFVSKSAQEFHGQMHLLQQEMKRWKQMNYKILIFVANKERADRVRRIFADYQIEGIEIQVGQLQNGFEMPTLKVVVLTETEIFGQKQRKAKRVSTQTNAERIKNYQELEPGDYVVHLNHGIGRYLGIETLKVNDIHRDYLRLQYAGNDSLFVPIDQMEMIQKYVGSDDKSPKLYSLNGSEWKRTKSKVKKAVQDIADDLIKLYAERKMSQGHSFHTDSEWQKEFEAMFPYDETVDQLRSISEIKQDMEQSYPMDRLLCGDVGYGKTEVAIRAAFKAVLDGKQVGILVPTTILAQQHFENFKERFSGYPIQATVISRFRSRKEITESLKALKRGEIDVIIGTHRLLSKDVEFHDLGLLIIDEEQRFGVAHKEKMKQIKKNVDVLTLTATPIPRTLHMSLLGVRDLSLIETPPENRFPVETFVMEYNPIFIREVIEREIGRGGQVYFVHNKIEGIERMADQLQSLIPGLRVAIGHGQMGEQQLEKVMLEFLDRQHDVLVSTTIIETGLDIPNVNTLIVHDADKMGLSQLYQLRGRVGRSNRVAYAYFTYKKDKVLTEVAEKRLQAIREFTELGSGFKIAMRDLAIRGAGNLLGAEQHGHIAAVGFEMYNHLLTEAIEDLKKQHDGGEHEEQEEKVEPLLEMNLNAYIPSTYIEDSMQKVEFYKKLARVKELEQSFEIEEEMIDRFGHVPEEVELLLAVTRIKSYCYKYRITHIEQLGNEIHLKLHPSENLRIDGQQLFERASRFDRIQLKAGQYITVVVDVKKLKDKEVVEILEKWLYSYDGVQVGHKQQEKKQQSQKQRKEEVG
ncbi:transcription-repair coupling factor [Desulfuribacillus stibiiarsenatis]|uniref:Transcription-repair-coupling factor n=1 Tax=Desulfuribacillus stibiiarsenatis TaxID=1390249 RepID=A0A1E5L2F8_9FIRM|nr:transcription-repair coupling factor [Desulfuribacillus stibiiarsenatis]OEH84342.1 transcription-repair coupling factor [Desulfuribacillus stibiiarsenatis]